LHSLSRLAISLTLPCKGLLVEKISKIFSFHFLLLELEF